MWFATKLCIIAGSPFPPPPAQFAPKYKYYLYNGPNVGEKKRKNTQVSESIKQISCQLFCFVAW